LYFKKTSFSLQRQNQKNIRLKERDKIV